MKYGILVGTFAFFVNFLLLMGTSRWMDAPIGIFRALVASCIGAVPAAICFIQGFQFLGNGIWRILISFVTALIAFWRQEKPHKLISVFILLHIFLQAIAMGMGKGGPWALLVCCASILLVRWMDKEQGGSPFASVKITHGGKSVDLTALIDTGNTLTDPISGDAVLVTDACVAGELLGLRPEALGNPLQTLSTAGIAGLRLIPYHTVGNPSGLLLGIRADEVLLNGKRCRRIIAFAPHSIGTGKAYKALVGGMV